MKIYYGTPAPLQQGEKNYIGELEEMKYQDAIDFFNFKKEIFNKMDVLLTYKWWQFRKKRKEINSLNEEIYICNRAIDALIDDREDEEIKEDFLKNDF